MRSVRLGGGNWSGPGGAGPNWRGRRRPSTFSPERGGAAQYLKYVVVLLACVLVGTFVWQGVQRYRHPELRAGMGDALPTDRPYAAVGSSDDTLARRWQKDFASALESAADAAKTGDVTGAEMDVDRAAALADAAREKGFGASPEFFGTALRVLDRIKAMHPENDRLHEHLFQVKTALAELRSREASGAGAVGGDPVAGRVMFDSPRAVSAKQAITAKTFGGNYIDATRMPESSEVLLPPSTRSREDDVRVTGLTIEGAAQTLDGVAWKDVTFIGTRLRYEGGTVNLKNVKFERCSFGFSEASEGGEKLVDAILRGDTSVVVGTK